MAPTGSASAIVGATVNGHHLLHIESYSRTKEDLPTGGSIRSRHFRAGDHRWRVEYYPNGKTAAHAEFISVYLILDENGSALATPFKARAKFSLLDQAGKPVPSHTRTTSLCEYYVSISSSRHGFDDFIKREFLEKSEYLKDDCFTIRCDVIIPKKLHTEDRAAAPPLIPVPPSDLSRHLGDLLATKDGADVTFQVAGEMFSAHRCVLAARSPVFKAELFGAMKESTNTAVIRVDDMEPDVFGALLSFLYTDTLPDCPGKRQAAMTQHLLVAADRYNLKRLKLICEDNLCKHIETGTAATILALAEQHNCLGLKKACSQFLSSPSTLNAVLATDGFEHLARSCPSVVKEIISNISTRAPVDLGEARRGDMNWFGTDKILEDELTTGIKYLILVLVLICAVLSFNRGNATLSCFCLVVAFFVATTIS
uniref:BTB domain-containing protein n=1 Tax=Arundo donax TaxID=35708 RepID=A0A0A8XXL2_ARUDO